MAATDAKATGTDLQGASSGTNGGANAQTLQGSNPQGSADDSTKLNNLQPQGQITVQDISNQIIPKADSGGVSGPVMIAFSLVLALAVFVLMFKFYVMKADEKPKEKPVRIVSEAIPDSQPTPEKVVDKPAATTKKKKPASKKRSSTGRKKR